MPEPARLFVYGTLMPGQPGWATLRPFATSTRPATARGHLWDTGRGFPAMRFSEGGSAVPGCVVAISGCLVDPAVAALDDFEEEGRLYQRVRVRTSAGPAMGYEWLGSTEGLRRLADGWPPRPRRRPDTAGGAGPEPSTGRGVGRLA